MPDEVGEPRSDIDPHGMFNNFYLNLPSNTNESLEELEKNYDPNGYNYADARVINIETESMGRPYSAVKKQDNPKFLYSEKHLAETPREFYNNIDRVIKELGINYTKRPEPNNPDDLKNIIKPIYFRLRELGYTQRDLQE